MAAYMKHKFVFLGIKSDARRKLFSQFLRAHPEIVSDKAQLQAFVVDCWQQDKREIHYCAVDLLARKVKLLQPEDCALIETMVTAHSWWDTVDGIASNIIGPWLANHPDLVESTVQRWLDGDNLWLQRCCLLFQLKYKEKTDTDLLERIIKRLSTQPDFFIRKAIGWILRQYARTNPAFVKSFVGRQKLSPLSEREALKHLR